MEPGELNVDTRLGTLTVNSLLLHQPWVTISNPVALLELAELRGADRLVPHDPGVLARRRRRTASRRDLPIVVTGWCDQLGAKVDASQRYQQLIDNVEALETGLAIGEDAPAGETGTVTAVWTRPDASTRSGPVHVLSPMRWELHGFVVVGVLTLSIPGGRLT
jgi:hypothetical protein